MCAARERQILNFTQRCTVQHVLVATSSILLTKIRINANNMTTKLGKVLSLTTM